VRRRENCVIEERKGGGPGKGCIYVQTPSPSSVGRRGLDQLPQTRKTRGSEEKQTERKERALRSGGLYLQSGSLQGIRSDGQEKGRENTILENEGAGVSNLNKDFA